MTKHAIRQRARYTYLGSRDSEAIRCDGQGESAKESDTRALSLLQPGDGCMLCDNRKVGCVRSRALNSAVGLIQAYLTLFVRCHHLTLGGLPAHSHELY